MEPIPREDLERLMLFEQTREKAAADYLRSPNDAENLTRWGGALLELANFRQGQESADMVQEVNNLEWIAEAVDKLEEALKVAPKKHDTLWCLGNARTTQGLMVPETDKANEYFKQATRCFEKALEEDPHNDLYKKALELSAKAPTWHQELQRQLAHQSYPSSSSGGPSKGSKKKKKDNDFKYDVMGWIVLSVGIVAWMSFGKSAPPPPPPPAMR